MMDLIERVIDEDTFLRFKPLFAQELITGLARIHGQPVGIIANQPRVKGGVYFSIRRIKPQNLSLCATHSIFFCF